MEEGSAGEHPDWFLAAESGPETEWVVKGSSFLARAWYTPDEDAVRASLEDVRRRYHDATHHCWAYRRVQAETILERWDDNGEPSGTAGPPILGALKHADIVQTLVVVTRYFGGTKLGTGGLTRAYAEAARLCLEKTGRRKLWRLVAIEVRCRFEAVGSVETVLSRAGPAVREVEREFAPEPVYRVRVVQSQAARLAELLVEGTAGKATVLRDPRVSLDLMGET